jgi:hypothetical protein
MPAKYLINELGNEISVVVSRLSDGQIATLISGPRSTAENTITALEAEALRDLLDQVLGRAALEEVVPLAQPSPRDTPRENGERKVKLHDALARAGKTALPGTAGEEDA